ncbi:hemagglutinin repeat-containing protein [Phytopseudomonas dryadis]|uniref:hemagglutinin repeat-containing protein n=1 Tax=Pseudomonadaceae TaxID=135621 RepID=UPI001F61D5AB|nr:MULTISPECIES: hemagglutinin repeat-containing protein [Pseudomonas]
MRAGRDILIDAANEQSSYAREQSQKRTGTSTTVNHNFANTKDAISGTGKGENTVSQASSILKAVDGVSQFMSGPTFDGHLGSTSQSQSISQTVVGNRASTLEAGNDINLVAGNNVVIDGSRLQARRDIAIKGTDVTLGVAQGEYVVDAEQQQGKGGIKGGTSGGFKLGVGGSTGTATQAERQGTSSPSELLAGRDLNLEATNDLSLIGTRAQSGRDINLKAGNDLLIGAAQNQSSTDNDRRNAGGEVGVTVGSEGFGVYVSASLGKGKLDREGEQMQNAYLYAGRDLNFSSGRDTRITGAHVEGENVKGEVGRNLTVSSIPDTGKEYDVSATVTIGYGVSVSGSVGFGETSGKTDWVNDQTRVIARDRLDIRTEEHTQLDGAVIASQSGNLKLDTDTLGFRDIQGEDRERSYYLNAGGSYGSGQQDKSQVGKGEEGQTGWSLEGYEYEREREQIVRATVGEGEIVVRRDAETGNDSTDGLNRDVNSAYEITKDEESRTDLYVSKSSIEALSDPMATVEQWAEALANYDDTAKGNLGLISVGLNVSYNRLEKVLGIQRPVGTEHAGLASIAEDGLEVLLLNGMKLKDAKAVVGDAGFQQNVLAQLNAINGISEEQIREAAAALGMSLDDIPGLNEEKPQVGTTSDDRIPVLLQPEMVNPGDPNALQQILKHAANVQIYIDENPKNALAVGIVVAGLSGPKGVIQFAVEQAFSQTDIGQSINSYLDSLNEAAGRLIAEKIEGELDPENYPAEQQLIDGGSLITSILTGAIPGKGGKGKTEISVNSPGSLGHVGGAKDKYTPNSGSVGNMGEFLKQPGLGSQVNTSAQKTKQIYQGQSVYQVTSPIGDYLAKGDRFYLDGMHKNHLEVFDSKGRFKAVLNLDGSYNAAKTSKAISEGRRLAK